MEETAQVDQKTAQEIAKNLNSAGHHVGVEDVLPVGEIAHGIGSGVQDLATGSSKVRTVPSKKGLGEFVDRLLKMREPNEEVVTK